MFAHMARGATCFMSVNRIQFVLCLQEVLQLHTVLFIKKM
jgi:hypothetical protein